MGESEENKKNKILSEAHITLESPNIICFSEIDDRYFMDNDCWQGNTDGEGMTTFGLASEYDVVLCSWIKHHPDERSGKTLSNSDKKLDDPPASLWNFLDEAEKIKKDHIPGRGYILDWKRSTCERFTPDNQLLVFIGDLHLHLYKNETVDRFRFRPKGWSDNISLGNELCELLKLVDRIRDSYDVQTIQSGDMYEIWESEILLRYQYKEMLRVRYYLTHEVWPDHSKMSEDLNIRPMPDLYKEQRSQKERTLREGKVLPIIEEMINTGKVIPRRKLWLSEWDYWADYNNHWKEDVNSPADVSSKGIDFLNTENICKKIRERYPELFKRTGKWETSIFDHEVAGNHDNMLTNRYWELYSDDKFRKSSLDKKKILGKSTSAGIQRDKFYRSKSGGKSNGPVWVEHGHFYDWHNNDQRWYEKEHGFEVVISLLVSKIAMLLGVSKTSKSGGEILMWVGGMWSDLNNYEMRYPELRRTDNLFSKHKDLQLIVMGHTHSLTMMGERLDGKLLWYYQRDDYGSPGGAPYDFKHKKYYTPEGDKSEPVIAYEEPPPGGYPDDSSDGGPRDGRDGGYSGGGDEDRPGGAPDNV